MKHSLHGFRSRLPPERGTARQQFVEDRPKRINIHGWADRTGLASRLFRSHVARRSQWDTALRGPSFFFEASCESKVGDFWDPLPCEQDVRWFQISMNDAMLMCHLNRFGERRRQSRRLTDRLRGTRQLLRQAASLNEFHREVGSALSVPNLVNLHDIRMVQASRGSRFAHEALEFLWPGEGTSQQHLHRDGPIEPQVP